MTVNIENNKRRPMLRNKNINYSRGMFFVTMQAVFNKTIFGAIVGEKCVLNELGEAVATTSARSCFPTLFLKRNK